jgi:hypothetical protein
MEDLKKQIKSEIVRTFSWSAIACLIAAAVYYLAWVM